MSVYFDDKVKVSAEEKKKVQDIKRGAEAVANLVRPLVLMLVWNWIMPGLFGLPTIGYLKAFGLYIMSRILFNHEDVNYDE
tara:strand:+ start:227 stop:469 length:243 start_codon:yes stop_codon:yes gene_type:complete